MNTDTPRTNEALAAILERDGELSEKNAPEVLVKLCRAMECKVEELNHQLARSQEAATIWYRRCFSEDAEWNLGELTKLTDERDELRDMLQEEQRLHVQTLNERDEARQWESQALVARIQRDEWKAKYIQQNKDLGCEMMDPNGTIWDHAKKLQKDIAAINDRRDNFEERLRVELGGHPDSELWGDAGLIAATMWQRGRLAEALRKATGIEKPEAQRIAIAEACGWELKSNGLSPMWSWQNESLTHRIKWVAHKEMASQGVLPDYLNDLNAMHEAERRLEAEDNHAYGCYCSELYEKYGNTVSLTAAQRAESFPKHSTYENHEPI
jgi:hypothetical protein